MKRFHVLVCFWFSVAISVFWCNSLSAADTAVPSQLRLPLTIAKGGRIFVSIKLDNSPAMMLVDSGAPQSFVHGESNSKSKDESAIVVRGMAGVESMAMAKNVEMDFGQTISATVKARVLDLSAFRETTVKNDGWPLIAGALGADVLSAFQATVDYNNRLLILNIPRS